MILWVCRECSTAHEAGIPGCPECASTEYEEFEVPTITSAGPSNAWEPQEPELAEVQLQDADVQAPEEDAVAAPAPAAADVRAWAKENGIDVNAKGAVPAAVVEQYVAAQKEK